MRTIHDLTENERLEIYRGVVSGNTTLPIEKLNELCVKIYVEMVCSENCIEENSDIEKVAVNSVLDFENITEIEERFEVDVHWLIVRKNDDN
jgi:hypothetical protein